MTPRKYTFICCRCGSTFPPKGRGLICTACLDAAMPVAEMIERYRAGQSASSIAERADLPLGHVTYTLYKAGVRRADRPAPQKVSPTPARSPMTTEQMLALRDAGMPVKEIALRAGIMRASVYERLRNHEQPAGRAEGDGREEDETAPGPSSTIDDAFARGVVTIGAHTYTELLGSEGRISYACDASGDVWRLETGRKREWHGRRSNWATSHAARRIANPRALPSDWDRAEMKRRLEGERVS